MNKVNLTTKIERAISELRRGGKLVVSDNSTGISVLLLASELIENETVDQLTNLALLDQILYYLKTEARLLE